MLLFRFLRLSVQIVIVSFISSLPPSHLLFGFAHGIHKSFLVETVLVFSSLLLAERTR